MRACDGPPFLGLPPPRTSQLPKEWHLRSQQRQFVPQFCLWPVSGLKPFARLAFGADLWIKEGKSQLSLHSFYEFAPPPPGAPTVFSRHFPSCVDFRLFAPFSNHRALDRNNSGFAFVFI